MKKPSENIRYTPESHQAARKPILSEFRKYAIRGANPAVGGCVYKLSYNDRYVIVKAKEMGNSVAAIQKALNQFIRQAPSQHKKENLYYHLFKYIQDTPDKDFRIELILEDDSAYALLRAEHVALRQAIKDKKCLNNNTEAYIPEYNEATGMHGWISKSAVLNFRKWLKTHKSDTSM